MTRIDRAVRTKRTMGQTTDWRLETQHLSVSPESEAVRCAGDSLYSSETVRHYSVFGGT